MKTYSPELKAAVIARMIPPHNQPVVQIARSEGIPVNTLYTWRSKAGISTASTHVEVKPPQQWSREARFAILVETAPLSAHAVAEYCRRKGLANSQTKCNKVTHRSSTDKIVVLTLSETLLHEGKTFDSA